MDSITSLAEIKTRYSNCNLLMPVTSEVQLNPYYKYTVMEVAADVSDNSGDIFKVGSQKMGYDTQSRKEVYADVFSPAKPLLMKLAAAAGIQFDPNNTFGTFLSKNCYKAKAYGAMRMPDGTGKTHVDEKVINLEDEEDRFRIEFMDKSIQGISDWKAASAAAKLFKGDWVETGDKNDKGYPIKIYKIADEDRQKYIDRSVLVNMTLLRKTFAEKAMTGAILRVIRALIGLKGTYTVEELKKPFAIPRVTFSPDYSDPEVRRAMLDQGMNSVSNMFGSSRTLATPPIIEATGIDPEFNPEIFTENAAFTSDRQDSPADDYHIPPHETCETPLSQQPTAPQNVAPPPTEHTDNPNTCSVCGRGISDKVSAYSIQQFGNPICYKCQNGGAE